MTMEPPSSGFIAELSLGWSLSHMVTRASRARSTPLDFFKNGGMSQTYNFHWENHDSLDIFMRSYCQGTKHPEFFAPSFCLLRHLDGLLGPGLPTPRRWMFSLGAINTFVFHGLNPEFWFLKSGTYVCVSFVGQILFDCCWFLESPYFLLTYTFPASILVFFFNSFSAENSTF